MFSWNAPQFDYEPYPVCYANNFFSEVDYLTLAQSYPETELFQHMPTLGEKYSLSERNNSENYHRFLTQEPLWGKLHAFVKSERFIDDTLAFLKDANIDLGLKRHRYNGRLGASRASLLSRIKGRQELSARFEFSAMSGQGGNIRPHTDSPNKLITFVISMNAPGEWNEAWGGGTQVCLPKDRTKIYNHVNRYMDFEDVDVIKSYGFVANQCLLFIKTYNSWHQVTPINAPPGAPLRKTLTINIEQLI